MRYKVLGESIFIFLSQAHFNSLILFRPSEVKSFEPGTVLIQGILVQVLNAGSAYIDNNFIFNTIIVLQFAAKGC